MNIFKQESTTPVYTMCANFFLRHCQQRDTLAFSAENKAGSWRQKQLPAKRQPKYNQTDRNRTTAEGSFLGQGTWSKSWVLVKSGSARENVESISGQRRREGEAEMEEEGWGQVWRWKILGCAEQGWGVSSCVGQCEDACGRKWAFAPDPGGAHGGSLVRAF